MTKHFTTKTDNGYTIRTYGDATAVNGYFVELHTNEHASDKLSYLALYLTLDDSVCEIAASAWYPCCTKRMAHESVRDMLCELYAQALKCHDAKRVLATLTEFAQFVL